MPVAEQMETLRRIAEQRAILASMAPGTQQHRLAIQILTMLEQMLETERAIAKLKDMAEGCA